MQNVELKFGHVVSNAQLNVVCPPRRVARPLPGVKELIPERTLISPKGGGGWIGVTTKLNSFSPNTWADSAPQVRPVVMTGQIGQALDFTGDTGQTGVAQSTCKNNFKHLLTSSMNQIWWMAFVDDRKQGNEPCTHK
jgi:hypothetical protein